jgi:steroid delta-isomerase-like uncharacterized protein
MSTTDPKTTVRRSVEEPFNHGNLASLDATYDPDCVSHRPSAPTPTDLEGTREFVRAVRTAYPDAQVTIHDLVAEGEQVATRWTFRGTNTGPFWDEGPTGMAVEIPGITFARLHDGRIIEEWVSWDELELQRQLGRLPRPEPASS